jgi:hypothetical protein
MILRGFTLKVDDSISTVKEGAQKVSGMSFFAIFLLVQP